MSKSRVRAPWQERHHPKALRQTLLSTKTLTTAAIFLEDGAIQKDGNGVCTQKMTLDNGVKATLKVDEAAD